MALIVDWGNRIAKGLGYVYLFYYPKDFSFKLGVSNHPKRRYQQVAADLPDDLHYIGAFPAFEPYKFESWVKRKYKGYCKIPQDAGPRAGKNEFYSMRVFPILFVLTILKAISYFSFLPSLIFLIAICFPTSREVICNLIMML